MVYSDYLYQLALLMRDPIYRERNDQPGAGHPVLLLPGFLVGDWTLHVMAGWLRRLGYRPYLSGIVWNVHAPERTGALLAQRLAHIVGEPARPVIVIGHSLGGVLARFLGAAGPLKVRHVVTLGSPLSDAPHAIHPFIRSTFQMLQKLRNRSGAVSPAQAHFAATVAAPLPTDVGCSVIFSQDDEIVDWRVCLDPYGSNYQVSGRHMGLVVNRAVYRLLESILNSGG
ncbi:MAG: alpha/beta fold hydrolase [Deltaproteobacteria bacterium]|nr:alpha/beta fold hydrolase [Deltaproteobacteria bacterium]